jgi:hypothetical protein
MQEVVAVYLLAGPSSTINCCVLVCLFVTQDGGGVTKDGGLPPAPVLSVSGERELVHELERIIDSLNKGAAVDWEKRCAAAAASVALVTAAPAAALSAHLMCPVPEQQNIS